MNPLLQKSNDSLRACEALIERPHQLFTASVHHAYYSSLQRSMHILQTHFPASLIDPTDDGTSHQRTIKALEQKLVDAGYRFDALDYDQDVGRLKRNRVRADYKAYSFNEYKSRECLQLAQKLQRLLDRADINFASR